MENKEKLGQEPAFPIKHKELTPFGELESFKLGMSKRFYAACAAMQGLLSQHIKTEDMEPDCIEPVYQASYSSLDPNYYELVRDAYRIADELLKQENE